MTPRKEVTGKVIVPWSDDETNRLMSLINAGHSNTECAKLLGRTKGQISGARDRLRKEARLPPIPELWPAGRAEQLAELMGGGATFREAALKIGVSRNTAICKASRMGLVSRSQNVNTPVAKSEAFWTVERVETLTRLWTEGKAAYIIARELGTSEQSVKRKRARMGLATREKTGRAKWVKLSASPDPVAAVNRRPPAPVAQEPPTTAGFTLISLPHRGCKWPIWGAPRGCGEDTRFCGERAVGVYCEDHQRIAWRGAA